MATYQFTTPDGQPHEIETPDHVGLDEARAVASRFLGQSVTLAPAGEARRAAPASRVAPAATAAPVAGPGPGPPPPAAVGLLIPPPSAQGAPDSRSWLHDIQATQAGVPASIYSDRSPQDRVPVPYFYPDAEGTNLGAGCDAALKAAKKPDVSISNAYTSMAALEAAHQRYPEIPVAILAAIGIRETGFVDMKQRTTREDQKGYGVFQDDLLRTGHTEDELRGIPAQAMAAAKHLNDDLNTLRKKHVPSDIELPAVVKAYNLGPGKTLKKIRRNPQSMNESLPGQEYRSRVMDIAKACFPGRFMERGTQP